MGMAGGGLGLGQGIGSWVTSKLGGGAIANWIGLNAIAPGVGMLIGFVIGALIGNLFGKKKQRVPSAWADVVLNGVSRRLELGGDGVSNGGNIELARNMGAITKETLNGIIDTIAAGQTLRAGWTGFQGGFSFQFGHTSDQLWVKLGGSYAGQTNVSSADEAVDKAVLWALPNLRIAGGNMFIKRAVARTQATSVAVLSGDMQIAEDYGFYLQNRAVIDAAIAEPYTSLKLATVDYLARPSNDNERSVDGHVHFLRVA